jgi:hypothetical protein
MVAKPKQYRAVPNRVEAQQSLVEDVVTTMAESIVVRPGDWVVVHPNGTVEAVSERMFKLRYEEVLPA